MWALLFRNLFKGGMIVDLSDKIDSCSIYLDMFKIRYGDVLNVDYDIDQEILDYGIARNIMQPILENYFIHGLNRIVIIIEFLLKVLKTADIY
jgi:two-component system sensor histidine kinase YesM